MSINRFLQLDDLLQQTAKPLKSRSNKATSKSLGCPKVSELPIDSDEFILDILEFFFEERLTKQQLNNNLREIAARATWEATQASKAMDFVPRPSGGRPSAMWLVTQAVQIAIRKAQNQCIYEAVRVTVKLKMRSEYILAKQAVEMSYYPATFSTNNLSLSGNGIDFITQFEGFSPTLYDDPGGHCTIGYGTLVHKGNCNGTESEEFKTGITQDRAKELLAAEISTAVFCVNNQVKVALTQSQFDALVSFVYNVGSGAFQQSALLAKLNKGEYDAVPVELKKWVKSGGKTLPGLVRRREAESNLFTNGSYSSSQSVSNFFFDYQFTDSIPLTPVSGGRSIFTDALEVGDIIVSTEKWSPVSIGIRAASNSPVSHAIIYIGNGQVVEATRKGVVLGPLDQAISHATLAVAFRKPGLTEVQKNMVREFAGLQEGKKYNYESIIKFVPSQVIKRGCDALPPAERNNCLNLFANNLLGKGPADNTFFCSELVIAAYNNAGVPITKNLPYQTSPNDIATLELNGTLEYVGHLKTP